MTVDYLLLLLPQHSIGSCARWDTGWRLLRVKTISAWCGDKDSLSVDAVMLCCTKRMFSQCLTFIGTTVREFIEPSSL